MRDLGRIVRLQIQRASLKTGEKPTRVYDPTPLLAVDRLALGPDGALGEGSDGSWLVDVHHRAHPRTKNEDGAHGVSLGFTSHYALMRDRFGERITLGCAGENIIVETERRMVFADLEHGVAASGTHGVREGEQAPHALNFARLAPDDAPALGGMIADLEEAPIHGYVAPVHVQHHDVARRDAHYGVPGTPTQQMGTGPADPGPALGLEPRRCHWSKRNAHPVRITPSTCDLSSH